MTDSQDVRWRQRFTNLEKAFALYQTTALRENLSDIEKMGLIQSFEILFELSWKIMKDALEEEGYKLISPRQAIKQAFQSELIDDGDLWLKALSHRNETVHLYDEKRVDATVQIIQSTYLKMFQDFYHFFKDRYAS